MEPSKQAEQALPEQTMSVFAPFRLDLVNEQLWRGREVIRLRPKTFAVLRCLTASAGQLVTKDDLLALVWPETTVSEAALTVCIGELRQALQDNARTPQFIETIHRRGYRFIAAVTPVQGATQTTPPSSSSQVVSAVPCGPVRLVGREAELTQLHEWLAKALRGERQVGFITGAVGMGKTTLVDTFVAQVAHESESTCWIGHGQCIEHYGTGEAYLPLLEAFGRLCRSPQGQPLIDILYHQAPSWLLQMPGLLSANEYAALQQQSPNATRERMLRELTEAVDSLTAAHPLVLVLEDLHWSDVSTYDWLVYVARRRDPARLLVLGTYRPFEAIAHPHPLQTVTQDLQLHGQVMELDLSDLSEAEVGLYLRQRLGRQSLSDALAPLIHQRTSGNPLFMVTVVDMFVQRGALRQENGMWVLDEEIDSVARRVPESLQPLIDRQLEQISREDVQVLEAASVAGITFAAAAAAAAASHPNTEEEVETRCDKLARQHLFIDRQDLSAWPDGTVSACYTFTHPLYQDVIYHRIPAGRCARLHQQIGARLEVGYGDRSPEIAAELAEHFLRGQDARRAVSYLQYAGENAQRRAAAPEAMMHLKKGLDLLTTLPESRERLQRELDLLLLLRVVLVGVQGHSDPEVVRIVNRAHELSDQLEERPRLFSVTQSLWAVHVLRAEVPASRELAGQLFTLAQDDPDPTALFVAHQALGQSSYHGGEFELARVHFEQCITLYDPQKHRLPQAYLGVQNYAVSSHAMLAGALWMLGYPERARHQSQAAFDLAQELFHPISLAFALHWIARIQQYRQNRLAVQEAAESLIALATEQAAKPHILRGKFYRGWALAAQGNAEAGLAEMQQSLKDWQDSGAAANVSYYLALLAARYAYLDQADRGLRLLDEAMTFVQLHGERYYEAEVYRLQGECLMRLKIPDTSQAETCLLHAREIARSQHAKSLELRAAMSLSRLWKQQGKRQDAHDLLAPVYGWFTEGFDTADLQEAKVLLAELKRSLDDPF